ncbi:MAG: Cof-type HAD-IIB family hydrolase [Eubacterium sp.]|nr:Cof-type HAD-IIB family hydrolase [Eubacterium sp.]MDY5496794.1 Cof-type HAD-IIB family hydrolase [Anaerobutyricum sp.]
MGKLLFFDIDGTLVGFDGKMPESAVKGLKEAQKNGHKVFLCTGRSYNQIYPFLLDFGFDGIVGAAGAYVEYEGKELFHSTFNEEQFKQVMRCFEGTQGAMICQAKDICLSADCYEPQFVRAFSSKWDISSIKDIDTFHALIMDNDLSVYPEKYRNQVECIIYCESAYTVEEMQKMVSGDIHVEMASYKTPEPYSGEITLTKNSKQTGIEKILDYLGKGKEDVIAFGDGANDMEMLDFAGISVVMGNAREEIKEHGDYITTNVDQDGIYNALKHYHLI